MSDKKYPFSDNDSDYNSDDVKDYLEKIRGKFLRYTEILRKSGIESGIGEFIPHFDFSALGREILGFETEKAEDRCDYYTSQIEKLEKIAKEHGISLAENLEKVFSEKEPEVSETSDEKELSAENVIAYINKLNSDVRRLAEENASLKSELSECKRKLSEITKLISGHEN